LDEFPEVFRRLEKVVDADNMRSFQEILVSFSYWAGKQWKGTRKQVEALKVEAWKRGIPVPVERRPKKVKTWRHETVTVQGKIQSRYRDLKTGRFIKKPF
jgi:hypothetical protein